jgi:hypothetical protein
MAERHLALAVVRRFKGLTREERIARIEKLAGSSPEDERFVRETFPGLYREAFLSLRRVAGGHPGASRRHMRTGRRR